MSDNNSIWDISSKTIILAVDLVVDESLNLPQRVAAALQTPRVENAIRKALEAEAKKQAVLAMHNFNPAKGANLRTHVANRMPKPNA